MGEKASVVSVNISSEKGTAKRPVAEIIIDERGVAGDAHSGGSRRHVSMLAQESIERFGREVDRQFKPGEFAENITTCGVDLMEVSLLDRFEIGPVGLEVTEIGKECHGDTCAIFREVGACVMPREGIFCRSVEGGTVKAGDEIVYSPKVLRCRIITVSDRASGGEYEDQSGPRVRELLEESLQGTGRRYQINSSVVPDEQERIRDEIRSAHDDGVDVIFTTGGTGVGPRDVTPDAVMSLVDKTIPGIMEHIRTKFGSDKPNALLSRSVAAVWDTSLIYVLPGSVKAVQEYMGEVLKTLEHLIFTVHGLDVH